MKTNRDLLSESIADAQTVKETALANAKLALEEQFTPYLKEKLFAKLAEMEEAEEKEEVKEEIVNEEAESMEEISLDELLAELEEGETEINEAEKEEKEEKEEEEEISVEDMSEDDLKSFIEGVIQDMVAAGELEASHEDEENEEVEEEAEETEDEIEVEDEEEINIEELLSETEEITAEEETIEEGKGMGILKGIGNMFNPFKQPAEFVKEMEKKLKESPELKDDAEFMAQYKLLKSVSGVSSAAGSFTGGGGSGEKQSRLEETNEKEKELEESRKLVKTLTSELNEVNLLNAKLLYTNKIFRNKTLTETQKVKVLTAFDKATTKKEVELVYETLQESFKVSTLQKAPIKESLGSASKSIASSTQSKPIIEDNAAFSRMRELAFGSKK